MIRYRLSLQVYSDVAIAFLDFVGVSYCPPTSANVRRRRSLFNRGKTFCLCVSHLVKARQILDITTNRYGESTRPIAKGLRNAQDLSFKFRQLHF